MQPRTLTCLIAKRALFNRPALTRRSAITCSATRQPCGRSTWAPHRPARRPTPSPITAWGIRAALRADEPVGGLANGVSNEALNRRFMAIAEQTGAVPAGAGMPHAERLDGEDLEGFGKMLDQRPARLRGRTVGMTLAEH